MEVKRFSFLAVESVIANKTCWTDRKASATCAVHGATYANFYRPCNIKHQWKGNYGCTHNHMKLVSLEFL